MKKIIFGIFAHPDDEAFGPAGTLIMEKTAENEVHLICATGGENGTNPDEVENLGEVRLSEWRAAGELIGADSMHHLGYEDGTLSNNVYLSTDDKVKTIVTEVLIDKPDIEVEFMTLDPNGLTGHIDHIVISRVATFVFFTLKQADARFTRIRYSCFSNQDSPESDYSWLYMDAGHAPEEIGETVDASEYLAQIKSVMNAHNSQRGDRDSLLARLGDKVAINHFLVKR